MTNQHSTAEVEVNSNENVQLKVYTEKEYNDLYNKYLMSLADVDNIKKHYAKLKNNLYAYQYEDMLINLLQVLDDFERCLKITSDEGVELIYNKLYNTLTTYGLTKYSPVGEVFNADTMEAVTVIAAGQNNSGKVIDCTLIGYMYKDKIIRYPKVVVGE